jgi:hypothetical protein
MGRADAEAEARTVGNAGWNGDADQMPERGVASTAARQARFRPRFTASAAAAAGASQSHFDRHDGATERFTRGERHFRRDGVVVFPLAEKRIADALDQRVDGRKIDGDFVGETIVSGHAESTLTIGGGSSLVKTATVHCGGQESHREHGRCETTMRDALRAREVAQCARPIAFKRITRTA